MQGYRLDDIHDYVVMICLALDKKTLVQENERFLEVTVRNRRIVVD